MYPADLVKVCRFPKKQLRVCKSACFFGFKYKINEFLCPIALNELNGIICHLKPFNTLHAVYVEIGMECLVWHV